MKYKYNIKNLDCANCAKKIEEKLNKDKNIKNTIVNFSTSTVSVETDLEKPFEYVKQIVSEVEPDAILSEEKVKEDMKKEAETRVKYRYLLEAIVKAEKIEISEKDAKAELKKMAENYKMTEEDLLKESIKTKSFFFPYFCHPLDCCLITILSKSFLNIYSIFCRCIRQ